MRLVEGLVNLDCVRVTDVGKTSNDVLRNIESLEDTLEYAVSTLGQGGVKGALELELLNLVTKFSRSTDDERNNGRSGCFVRDGRGHRVDELVFELVLGRLRGVDDVVSRVERVVGVCCCRSRETVRQVKSTSVET